jgi:hypothetical protein
MFEPLLQTKANRKELILKSDASTATACSLFPMPGASGVGVYGYGEVLLQIWTYVGLWLVVHSSVQPSALARLPSICLSACYCCRVHLLLLSVIYKRGGESFEEGRRAKLEKKERGEMGMV